MPRRRIGDGRPLPYAGPELERLERLGKAYTRSTYGDDQSGERLYRFNSLGYRGADFDAGARHRIFAFGESHAFGFGLDFDRCWPSRFVDLWLAADGLDRRDACYLNFADVGASNGGIARSLVSQCFAVRPDLVLVHFGDPRRAEIFLEGRTQRIGPWLLDEPAARTARAAPKEGNLRRNLLELLERGEHFYRFAAGSLAHEAFSIDADSYFLLETLRSILLVQYFCRAQGIRAVATWEQIHQISAHDVRDHEGLGPLVDQIDPGFLADFSIWDVDGEATPEGKHAGPRRHEALARSLLDFHLRSGSLPPASPERPRPAVPEGRRVRAFYEEKPFNHWRSARAAADSLRRNPVAEAYPDLDRLLRSGGVRTILDCGCGSGWLTCALALHYGVEVTGLDFSLRALARARGTAGCLGVAERIRLIGGDLFELRFDGRFDLAVSLGVLHHTADTRRAFEHLRRSIHPGGHVYVGLYHEPARKTFLDYFRDLLRTEGEALAFREFRRLHPSRRKSDHVRSWFHDQVLHPHESSHTLREATEWLEAGGLELVSTSINRFQEFERTEELFTLEPAYAERAALALERGRFLPGFFTFMARRRRPRAPD